MLLLYKRLQNPLLFFLGCAFLCTNAVATTEIKPYRAFYNMKLGKRDQDSSIVDVSGKMYYQWQDVCDGWVVEQHIELTLADTQGNETKTSTNYTTWESKDGLNYRFQVRNLVDDQIEDEYRGQAKLSKIGGIGVAKFTQPSKSEISLPAGTVFPAWQIQHLLESAAKGDRMVSQNLFDGTAIQPGNKLSAFIGSPIKQDQNVIINNIALGPLRPYRLAFFSDQPDSLPQYEMSLNMSDNGINKSMVMDYGSFTVLSELEALELLPKPDCD